MANKEWTWIDPVLKQSLLLNDSDVCFYYLVRTSGGYAASTANSRIDNFKRKPEKYRTNAVVWSYKTKAIQEFADDVTYLLTREDITKLISSYGGASLIPMPTSKPKNHPDHDTRIKDMCEIIVGNILNIDMDDAFDMRTSVRPSHEGGSRDIAFLHSNIIFNGLERPESLVFLIDDVLVKGSHYIVCRDKILNAYPDATIIGIFLSIHQSDYVDYGAVEF